MIFRLTMPRVLKSEFTVWLVGSCLPDIQREEGGSGGSHPELVYSYSNKQLPTNLDALKRLFYNKKTDMKGKPLSDVVQKVVLDIMAKIPFMQTKNATKKLENLFNKWRLLQKREKNTSAKDLENRKEFSDKLGLLFDIASQDWEKKISTDRIKDVDERAEDLNFLVDQRGPRVRYLGEFSEHFAEAVTDKEAREASSEAQSAAESARQEKVRSEAKKRRELATKEIICENNNDEDFEVEAKKAKKSKTVTLEVPRKILQAPGVCQMLDRTKQTTRSAMGNLATFITASGGDLEDFNLSTQTVWLTRNAKRVEEYEKFYESFQPPKHAVVGWDGKVVKEVLGADGPVEYLAIVLSGSPNMVEGKMLEVEEISDGTGKTQCETTFAVLAACRATDSIRAVVFDTTASNTGIRQGAASRLVEKLGRVLMWFECRHHMAELFMKPVWIMLFGVDSSPEWSDFGLFKKMFPYIKKEEKVLLDIKPGLEEQLREKSVEFLTSLLMYPNKKQQFPTNNYREMVELTLAVLGGNVPGGFKFRLPGAFHKARFMANVIYGTKMFLLQNLDMDEPKMEEENVAMEIEFDKEYKEALAKFVKFTSLVYVPYFMKTSIGADAPYNDLELFKLLLKYKEQVDSEVAEFALKAMKRHLYYLTQENVIMSLFSNRLDDDQKSRIASRLLTFPKPEEFKAEKPTPPTLLDMNTTLEALVGEKSWTIFQVLGVKTDWLEHGPSKWSEDSQFCEVRDWVRTAKVVNDSCERAIKMVQDFCNTLTSDSFIRRGLLKAVNSSREQFPDFRKKTMNKTFE